MIFHSLDFAIFFVVFLAVVLGAAPPRPERPPARGELRVLRVGAPVVPGAHRRHDGRRLRGRPRHGPAARAPEGVPVAGSGRQPRAPGVLQVLQLLRRQRRGGPGDGGLARAEARAARRAARRHLVLHVPGAQLRHRRVLGIARRPGGASSTSARSSRSSPTCSPGRSCGPRPCCRRSSASDGSRRQPRATPPCCSRGAFFKKLVIADNVGVIANKVFALQSPEFYVLWAGVFAFGIQIYADFSAYADIARGVATWLGIDLIKNFEHPYLAKGPTEFWRRWNISLSTWFRDYVFLPVAYRISDRLPPERRLRIDAATWVVLGRDDPHHADGRTLARRQLELRHLGRVSRRAAGPCAHRRRDADTAAPDAPVAGPAADRRDVPAHQPRVAVLPGNRSRATRPASRPVAVRVERARTAGWSVPVLPGLAVFDPVVGSESVGGVRRSRLRGGHDARRGTRPSAGPWPSRRCSRACSSPAFSSFAAPRRSTSSISASNGKVPGTIPASTRGRGPWFRESSAR